MRAQRRAAFVVFVPIMSGLVLLLAVTATVPALGEWKIGDVPALWLMLGPVALFAMLAATAVAERRALRLERQWSDQHQ